MGRGFGVLVVISFFMIFVTMGRITDKKSSKKKDSVALYFKSNKNCEVIESVVYLGRQLIICDNKLALFDGGDDAVKELNKVSFDKVIVKPFTYVSKSLFGADTTNKSTMFSIYEKKDVLFYEFEENNSLLAERVSSIFKKKKYLNLE